MKKAGRIPRIYQDQTLAVDQSLLLDAAASNHVARVLRLSENAHLILFNGKGGQYQAHITQLTKHQVAVQIDTFMEHEVESLLTIHLGQGISRGDKMDTTLQKAVELGVTTITPLLTQHCQIKHSNAQLQKKVAHWQKIIISACEQCGRNKIPALSFPQSLDDWLAPLSKATNLVLNPTGDTLLTNINPEQGPINLLIGPEGGLAQSELDKCKPFNFHQVKLGPRILRTETAAISTISIIQALWGDFCNK